MNSKCAEGILPSDYFNKRRTFGKESDYPW